MFLDLIQDLTIPGCPKIGLPGLLDRAFCLGSILQEALSRKLKPLHVPIKGTHLRSIPDGTTMLIPNPHPFHRKIPNLLFNPRQSPNRPAQFNLQLLLPVFPQYQNLLKSKVKPSHT
jgi:hypothetical protein